MDQDQSYWEHRYRTGDMPWEKGEASPGLVDFLAGHAELPHGIVAIPGCGTGHDVRAWAQAGFDAWGFDLARSAIRLCEERTQAAGLKAHFLVADFLDDPPPQRFDWLFEHTLFCAIDPKRRDDYVQATLRWLKPDGQLLAVHYLIPDKEGAAVWHDARGNYSAFFALFRIAGGLGATFVSKPNGIGADVLVAAETFVKLARAGTPPLAPPRRGTGQRHTAARVPS